MAERQDDINDLYIIVNAIEAYTKEEDEYTA